MTFDKSKVCVAGVHEVKAGTKGYFSDQVLFLELYVKGDDKSMYGTIMEGTQGDWYKIIEENGDPPYWRSRFFYPCEEQVTYRPYRTLEEAMVLKGKWIKHKAWDERFMVTRISFLNGSLLCNGITADVLYNTFVMEDGTPVGVEV